MAAATARLGDLPRATRDQDRQKWRRPGGQESRGFAALSHGLLATWNRPMVFGIDRLISSRQAPTEDERDESRLSAWRLQRPGVASRHGSQSGCRIRPCEDAPLRAAAAAAAAKPFTASLQAACLPVLSSVSAQTAQSGNCGQIARLNCGKAGAGTREATSEDAKIRKWRKPTVGERVSGPGVGVALQSALSGLC